MRLEPPPKLSLLGLAYRGLDVVNQVLRLPPAPRARLEELRRRWLQPSLVLLDVGMATELSSVDQENMVGLFRSFAAMDGRACAQWTLRFSGARQQRSIAYNQDDAVHVDMHAILLMCAPLAGCVYTHHAFMPDRQQPPRTRRTCLHMLTCVLLHGPRPHPHTPACR